MTNLKSLLKNTSFWGIIGFIIAIGGIIATILYSSSQIKLAYSQLDITNKQLAITQKELLSINQQILETQKYRYLDSLMRLTDNWLSPEMCESKREIAKIKKLTPKHFDDTAYPEEYIHVYRIATFFENLGYQVHKDYILFEDAFNLIGGSAMKYWEKYRIAMQNFRIESGRERYGEWFEDFYNKCKEESSRQKLKKVHSNDDNAMS